MVFTQGPLSLGKPFGFDLINLRFDLIEDGFFIVEFAGIQLLDTFLNLAAQLLASHQQLYTLDNGILLGGWRCSLEDASKSLSVEEWLVEVLLVSERTLKATSQDDVFIGANTALCSLPMLSIVWRCACEYNLDYQGLKRQSGKGQTSGISPAYIDDKMLH